MKRLFLLLPTVLFINIAMAQSVGIGTGSPNSKAQLEISSTTKGLLIPSMTTSQRLGISSPPNGLLVYDTDKNEFYHYNSDGWTGIVNGTYWNRPITSRNRISTTDSVGIGTVAPTQRLDVNGNIRSRNNIEADGGLKGNTLNVSGVAVVGDNTLVNGDITATGTINSNEAVNLNNDNGIVQFKNAGDNKTYVQLSGDDLRMGTNSGNAAGVLKIRMNGTDRITVDASGTLDIPGKITTSSSGSKNLLPICYGYYYSPNNIIRGSGNFSITRTGVGRYNVYCNRITANTIVIVTNHAFGVQTTYWNQTGPGGPYIEIYVADENSQALDHGFNFVMFEG